ncbi:MAG: NUDIX hydrolase [Bdellovibrionota bacterium]
MHREKVKRLLKNYKKSYPSELDIILKFEQFINSQTDCFKRSLLIGHITASTWLVNSRKDSVLLLHHKKLNKWLQPGGHLDGNPDPLLEALREASEETGIKNLEPISEEIFDIDLHLIPEFETIPRHLHYDLRFLVQSHQNQLSLSNESNSLKWVPFSDVSIYNPEQSILRMLDKCLSYLGNSTDKQLI